MLGKLVDSLINKVSALAFWAIALTADFRADKSGSFPDNGVGTQIMAIAH